jgi:F-type H+-transporting ATPase subunit epsilon
MAEDTFKVKVVTPEGISLEESAEFVSFNSMSGQVGVLESHSELATQLKPGALVVRKSNSEETTYFVASGYAHVRNNELSILTPYLETQSDIDESRAKEAKQRAEKHLYASSGEDSSSVDRGRALLAMLRSEERLFVKSQK